ncbi:RagB/SusD family nutrient uptake outer membrane protein [Parapedobacter sp. ISTM3]|uniref:RagB/SusD family nutrient uptake outer membrane protein n=1 Tax=Parapedobacter sp. ISTM3 TaxID=2800130 RepID=UPI001906AC89|nr:RagB/SusD family nutrient uptake outer membrane protein [Parapedobacter sp. ISTM3]MBK1441405.1 RagB/SusD family nutrient uptake outer membrane protein [Parapedobacter sp. ISTM3]
MKRIIIIMLAGLLQACNNLDLVPISERTVEGYYQTEEHINLALLGCYNGLRSAMVSQQYSYMLTESRSDNTFQSLDYNDGNISRFSETSLLPILFTAWSDYYNKIQRCNKVLEEMVAIDMPIETARQYEGEAKFIRALLYFDLVRLWGRVPLVTTTLTIDEGYQVRRNEISEVYRQIESDLIDAANLLPPDYPSANQGRATSWAAKAFLGKVLVFMSGYPLNAARWGDAATLLHEVIESGRFEFFENYADVFSHEHESGRQAVFSLLFKTGVSGEGNPFPTRNTPNFISRALVPMGGSPFQLFLSNDLINSFENGDTRKEAVIWSEWTNNAGEVITSQPFSKKYLNGPAVQGDGWDIDWILLRYDDVLMLYAECLNELGYVPEGEAFDILNRIRQRAGLTPKTATDISDQQQFRRWVEHERRMEFCFENQRWFDLVRTDRALDVMRDFLRNYGIESAMGSRARYYYPVPQQVLDINPNLEQNEGYN